MQAAATLAFAEDYTLMRNGIQQGDKGNFFANYLEMESEYLLEEALLTCTQATNERQFIPVPDSVVGEEYFFEGNEGKLRICF